MFVLAVCLARGRNPTQIGLSRGKHVLAEVTEDSRGGHEVGTNEESQKMSSR